jgi:hypothetical protein
MCNVRNKKFHYFSIICFKKNLTEEQVQIQIRELLQSRDKIRFEVSGQAAQLKMSKSCLADNQFNTQLIICYPDRGMIFLGS